jgi:tripartite-type tricarboxylate transporter receptor subunit TctC
MSISRRSLLGAASLLCLPRLALGQDYPTRPVRIIVPSTAGGGTDTFARLVAQHLSNVMGQNFYVENRPGGGTLIGLEAAAHAPNDGYTFYMAPSTIVTMHLVRKAMSVDVRRDFTPVSLTAILPQVLIMHPGVPAKSVQELIALAKKEPGKLTYGSAGIGTAPHMAMELFKNTAGVDIQHVPYKGVANSMQDIIGGTISGMIINVLTSKANIEAGQLRALGTTGLKRVESLPEIPTVAESGLPGYEALQWFGVLAPAGTPAPIVKRVQTAMSEGLNLPEIRQRLLLEGAEAVGNSPEEFGAFINAEIDKWTPVAKAAGIEPQ